MHRDIKIGLILGLVLVIVVMVRIATDPRLSPGARIQQLHETTASQEKSVSPNDMSGVPPFAFKEENLPQSDIAENDLTQNELLSIEPKSEESTIETVESEQLEPPDSSQYEQAEKIKTQKFHIVRKNETLSAISQKYYGSANKWKEIYNANRNVIMDPNKIRSGIKLIIPDLTELMTD